jgi:hypothetical protein
MTPPAAFCTAFLILPRQRGGWRAQRDGGGCRCSVANAPSTMLRMVPLPRVAGEDQL